MDAMIICEQLLANCLRPQFDRQKRWLSVSMRIGGLAPDYYSFANDIEQSGKLDCIVKTLELTHAERLRMQNADGILLSPDFLSILSKSWLALTYETLRSIRQRVNYKPNRQTEWANTMATAYKKIERVRVNEFKREFAKGAKLKKTGKKVELYSPYDDLRNIEEYEHGKSVLTSNLYTRSDDGSHSWFVFNNESMEMEQIYRQDMSDEILSSLEVFLDS